VRRELAEAERAIAPEPLAAWLVALRADLRRAVRNILRVVSGREEDLRGQGMV
jgi:hypothetical protein